MYDRYKKYTHLSDVSPSLEERGYIHALDLNHYMKNFQPVVLEIMTQKAVRDEHNRPPPDGCTYWCDEHGKVVPTHRNCQGICADWGRFVLKKAIATLFKRLEADMLSSDLAPQLRAAAFTKAWRSQLPEALQHSFGDHSGCNPQFCPYCDGTTVIKQKHDDLKVTCEAAQREILRRLGVYFTDAILWQLVAGGHGAKATQKNESANKGISMFTPKSKKTGAMAYHANVAMSVSNTNALALERNNYSTLFPERNTLVVEVALQKMEEAGRLKRGSLQLPPRGISHARRVLNQRRRDSEHAATVEYVLIILIG
jgi:hypothetical protein